MSPDSQASDNTAPAAQSPTLRSGLQSVVGEIEKSLDSLSLKLHDFSENPDDIQPLAEAEASLADVLATIRVAGCHGGAALTDEMSRAVADLRHKRVAANDALLTALAGGALQLQGYLDLVAAGEPDHLLVFLPQINEIRIARGQSMTSDTELFVAHMTRLQPPQPLDENLAAEIGGLASRLALVQQQALVSWLKSIQPIENLKRAGKVCERISRDLPDGTLGDYWRLQAAVVESLLLKRLSVDAELQRVITRSVSILKVIGDNKVDAAADEIRRDVWRLLYHIAIIRQPGPRALLLRQEFGTSSVVPDPEAADSLRRQLSGADTQLLQQLSSAVREDIASVQDDIDLLVRAGDRAEFDVDATVATATRVANTLGMIGLHGLQRQMQEQADALAELHASATVDDDRWIDIATHLVRVEQGLDAALARELGGRRRDDRDDESVDLQSARDAIWAASLHDVSELKVLIESFIEDGAGSIAERCSNLVHDISSALMICGDPDAAQTVERFSNFLGSPAVLTSRASGKLADPVVDAVSALEMYLEARRDGDPGLSDGLVGVTEALRQLGVSQATDDAGGISSEPFAETRQIDLDADKLDRIKRGELDAVVAEANRTTTEVDPAIREIYLEEAEELLAALQQGLQRWSGEVDDRENLDSICRIFHTFKGSSRMVGALHVSQLAAAIEELCDACADGRRSASPRVVETVESAADRIDQLVSAFTRSTEPDDDGSTLIQQAHDLLKGAAQDEDIVGIEVEDEADPELVAIFAEEAGDLFDEAATALDRIRETPDEADPINSLARALHTLKGSARMVGCGDVGEICHVMESGVEATRDSSATFAAAELDVIAAALDEARDIVQRFHAGERQFEIADVVATLRDRDPAAKPAPSAAVANVDDSGAAANVAAVPTGNAAESADDAGQPAADTVATTAAGASADGGSAAPITPLTNTTHPADEPNDIAFDERLFPSSRPVTTEEATAARETARVAVSQLSAMLSQAGEVGILTARLEQQNRDLNTQMGELRRAIRRAREDVRQMPANADADQADSSNAQDAESSIRQESQVALSETVNDLESLQILLDELCTDSESLLQQLERAGTLLRQGLTDTLTVPFSRQVQRLQRVVRQVCREHNKRAQLDFSGTENEMDRNVLERITVPLEHILRNAIVHGIELPADRSNQRKAEVGHISINLHREGTELILEVQDDGRGLDDEAIRKTAIDRGLLAETVEISRDELVQFIFQPGFTTAPELTKDAGRGVGMDVVNAELKRLGGALEVVTKPGAGTCFTMRLPLTMALSQALLVQVRDTTFAVPLTSVESVARIERDRLDLRAGDECIYEENSERYRVAYLGDMFEGSPQPLPSDRRLLPLLLMRGTEAGDSATRRAIAVDDLSGNREIVFMPVGRQVSSVSGIAGATLMPDGKVVLVLDLPALSRNRHHRALRDQADKSEHGAAVSTDAAVDARTLVMVVDDSLTMRRVAENLLVKDGHRVVAARDGVDAIQQLEHCQPDLFLLDIEMPRMDGFELAEYIRGEKHLANTPIIMVSSRGDDKHMGRASEIGVNRFVVKPYKDDELMVEVRDMAHQFANLSEGEPSE